MFPEARFNNGKKRRNRETSSAWRDTKRRRLTVKDPIKKKKKKQTAATVIGAIKRFSVATRELPVCSSLLASILSLSISSLSHLGISLYLITSYRR